MNGLFVISYVLLCCVVLLKSAILRHAVREAVQLKSLYLDLKSKVRPAGLSVGARAPEFSASIFGTTETLRSSCLRGRSTILLFVDAKETNSRTYENLGVAIHVWWHRMQGNVYLVCAAEEELCRKVVKDERVKAFADDRVKVILDEKGYITRAFRITETPLAVELDEDMRIVRYGFPEYDKTGPSLQSEKRSLSSKDLSLSSLQTNQN